MDRSPSSGWYPDPGQSFELRYFDGQVWTDHVSSGGQQFESPLSTTSTPAGHDGPADEQSPSVFVSYRREETRPVAIALADRLRQDLTWQSVFRDEDNLIAGRSWQLGLVDAIQAASVVVVLVGDHWAVTPQGRARLADSDDPVANEILHALHWTSAFPVLVGDASPPEILATPEGGFELHAPDLGHPVPISAEVAQAVGTLFEGNAPRLTLEPSGAWRGDGYQGVLVGVWADLADRSEDGILVVADANAHVHLERFVQELQRRDDVSVEVLARFASGAQILSVRQVKKLAKEFPDVICLRTEDDTETIGARIRAIQAHKGVQHVEVLTVGSLIGYSAAAALGAEAAGSGSGSVADPVPATDAVQPGVEVVTSGGGSVSTGGTGLGLGAKLAAGVAAAVAATVGGVALFGGGGSTTQAFEGPVAFDVDGLQLRVTAANVEEISDQALLEEYRIFDNPAHVMTVELEGRATVPETDPSQYGEEHGFTPAGAFDEGVFVQSADGVLVTLERGREDHSDPAFRLSPTEFRPYTYRAEVPDDFDLAGASIVFAHSDLIRFPLDDAFMQGPLDVAVDVGDLSLAVDGNFNDGTIEVTGAQISRELGTYRVGSYAYDDQGQEREFFGDAPTDLIASAPQGMMWLHVQWRYRADDGLGVLFSPTPRVHVDGVPAPPTGAIGLLMTSGDVRDDEVSYLIPAGASSVEFLNDTIEIGSAALPPTPPEWLSIREVPPLGDSLRVWTGDQICGLLSIDELREGLGTGWAYSQGEPGRPWESHLDPSDWHGTGCTIAAYFGGDDDRWVGVGIEARRCDQDCSPSPLSVVIDGELVVEARIEGSLSTGEPFVPPERVEALLESIADEIR